MVKCENCPFWAIYFKVNHLFYLAILRQLNQFKLLCHNTVVIPQNKTNDQFWSEWVILLLTIRRFGFFYSGEWRVSIRRWKQLYNVNIHSMVQGSLYKQSQFIKTTPRSSQLKIKPRHKMKRFLINRMKMTISQMAYFFTRFDPQ